MKAYCNEKIIADQVKIADGFFSRLIGLMNQKSMNPSQGLLLKDCSSVHCFFMKFPIDVVYLSKDMKVLQMETVVPWRIGKFVKKAAHVLELSAGVAENKILIGDYMEILE